MKTLKTQKGNGMSSIPILAPKPPLTTYVCKAGHTYKGTEPWRMMLPAGPNQALSSPPMCPECLFAFLGYQFPSWPEGITIQQAVEAGHLQPGVLSAPH